MKKSKIYFVFLVLFIGVLGNIFSQNLDKEYEYALKLFKNAEYDISIMQAKKIVENYPDYKNNDKLYLLIAQANKNLKNYQEALDALRILNNSFINTDLKEKSAFLEGEIYYEMKEYKKSEEKFIKLIADTIIDNELLVDTYNYLGYIKLIEEDYNNSELYFTKSLELKSDNDILYQKAFVLYKKNQFANSEAIIDSLFLKELSNDLFLKTRLLKAQIELKKDRKKEAFLIYKTILDCTTIDYDTKTKIIYDMGKIFSKKEVVALIDTLTNKAINDEQRNSLIIKKMELSIDSKDNNEFLKLMSSIRNASKDDSLNMYYLYGIWAYKNKNYSLAEKNFLQALTYTNDDTKKGEIYIYILSICFDTNQFTKVKDYLKNLEKQENFKDITNLFYAMLNEKEKKYEDALKNLLAISNNALEEIIKEKLFLLGKINNKIKKYDDAIKYFTEYELKYGYNEQCKMVLLLLVDSYYEKKNYIEAEKVCERYFNNYKDNDKIYQQITYNYAWIYFQKENYSKGIEIAEKLKSQNIDNQFKSNIYEFIGDCYHKMKNYNEALKNYNLSQNIEKRSSVYLKIGDVYFRQEKMDLALKNYNEALKISKIDLEKRKIYSKISNIYMKQNDYNNAIKILKDIVNKYSDDNMSVIMLADAYYNIGDFVKARENYNKVIKNEKKDKKLRISALRSIIWTYSRNGNYNEALNLIENLTKNLSGEELIAVLDEKKNIFISQEKYKNAIEVIEKIIKTAEESGIDAIDYKLQLAEIYTNMGDYDNSVNLYKSILNKIDDKELKERIYYNLADILLDSKKYNELEKIISEMRKNLDENSKIPDYFYSLYLRYGKKDNKESINILKKLATKNNKETLDYNVLINLVEIYFEEGEYQESKKYAEAILKDREDVIAAEAQYYIGVIYKMIGKQKEAILELTKVEYLYSAYDYWVDSANLELAKIYKELKDENKLSKLIEKLKKSKYNDIKEKLKTL